MKRPFLLFLFFMLLGHFLAAQVVFQIEKYNNPKPIKYYVGYILEYKEKSLPDDWQKQRISEINDIDKIIEFEGGYVLMDDIISIRRPKPIMNVISKMLYGFGASWAFFGTIAYLRGDFTPGGDTYAIGGLSILGGWIFSKFYYKTTKVNKRNRLRIIDISWPDPIGE